VCGCDKVVVRACVRVELWVWVGGCVCGYNCMWWGSDRDLNETVHDKTKTLMP